MRRLTLVFGCLFTVSQTPASSQALTPRVMDSLATVAITSPGQAFGATQRLVVAGSAAYANRRGDPPAVTCATGIPEVRAKGVVRRLEEIYRRTQDEELRGYIVERLEIQSECPDATRFLASVAREPGPPQDTTQAVIVDSWTRQQVAVSVLSHLGSWGVAELRTLYAEGTVREPFARQALEKLAARGFRPK